MPPLASAVFLGHLSREFGRPRRALAQPRHYAQKKAGWMSAWGPRSPHWPRPLSYSHLLKKGRSKIIIVIIITFIIIIIFNQWSEINCRLALPFILIITLSYIWAFFSVGFFLSFIWSELSDVYSQISWFAAEINNIFLLFIVSMILHDKSFAAKKKQKKTLKGGRNEIFSF